jgi:hypothetical protein
VFRDRGSSMRMPRAPHREGKARRFHLIEDLPKVIMGRKGSRLTEQRPVPFETDRHVAYSYDRPRALHLVWLRRFRSMSSPSAAYVYFCPRHPRRPGTSLQKERSIE